MARGDNYELYADVSTHHLLSSILRSLPRPWLEPYTAYWHDSVSPAHTDGHFCAENRWPVQQVRHGKWRAVWLSLFQASKAKEITMGMLIIPLLLIARLAGCLLGAYLQSRRPRRIPGRTTVRHTMYLLPERRERQ
ncbi:MAG TPA: hypothetical protein VGL94_20130 [Ktedonobacteraceae bacterium]